MRKQLYLLFFMLAGVASQGQQNVLATVLLPGVVDNAIIREYTYPKTISYIKTTEGCGFALADNNLILSWASLDCKYEIRDFEILGDIVYFCGEDISSKTGIVGWFDCAAMFYGGAGYHIYDTYYAVTDSTTIPYDTALVMEFNDLTIFTSPEYMSEYVHLALVGETKDSTACVAEMIGLPYTNNWIYTTGSSAKLSSNQAETMTQVVTTDNYIVTGGIFEEHGSGVSMRVFDRNNMFASSTLYNEIHRYSASANPCEGRNYPMYPTFRMFAANGDSVSTASFFYVPEMSYPPCIPPAPPYTGDLHGIVTHIFDIPTTITTLGAYCAYNSLVYVYNNGNCGINSLTYSHPFSTLQVLAETNTPSSPETVLGEFSIPASAAIPYTIVNNCWFYHHDNFDGESKWVSVGRKKDYPKELVFYTQPIMEAFPTCGTVQQIQTDVRAYQLKDEHVPLYLYNNDFEFVEIPSKRIDYKIHIKCKEY